MDEREGSRCAWCGSTLRSAGLAGAIVEAVNAPPARTRRTSLRCFATARARALVDRRDQLRRQPASLSRALPRPAPLRVRQHSTLAVRGPDGAVVRRRELRPRRHLRHARARARRAGARSARSGACSGPAARTCSRCRSLPIAPTRRRATARRGRRPAPPAAAELSRRAEGRTSTTFSCSTSSAPTSTSACAERRFRPASCCAMPRNPALVTYIARRRD